MTTYAICVCTRNRTDGLKKLLLSLERMILPDDVVVKLVVVENDSTNNSESIVNEFASTSSFDINYFLETRTGLAYARNRSVKESGNVDFCCFVDDDQEVDRCWLTELIRCQTEFDADGVWGTNPPLFFGKVPSYIKQFHTPRPFNYGEIVKTAFTNCLMLRKMYLDKIDGPFDLRLNYSGGEDRFLTFNISKLGGIIRCNHNSRAFEIIPESRATIKFVIRRTFRIANTGIFVSRLENPGLSIWSTLPRLIMRFCYGSLIIVPFFCFSNKHKLKGLIKIVNAIGGLTALLGNRDEFYK